MQERKHLQKKKKKRVKGEKCQCYAVCKVME